MRRTGLALPLGVALLFAAFLASEQALGQSRPAALSGRVSSAEEGPMGGVVITARKTGSTIARSVVSDDAGHYAFAAELLEPGRYALSTRAVGYDLNGPVAAQIAGDKPSTADLKLGPTRDLSRQLTNAEWILSVPGSDQQRADLLDCITCHSLDVIMRSTEDGREFAPAIARMLSYSAGSIRVHPQLRRDSIWGKNSDSFRAQADFLATINLGQVARWEYKLQTLPRVSGRGTRVIITEYDLPRRSMEPHDVVLAGGAVWFSNFGEQSLGRLDPASGAVREFPLALFKPAAPTGLLALESDGNGALWLGMMYQGALARFDIASETLDYWRLPPDLDSEVAELGLLALDVGAGGGRVWASDPGARALYRLDPATGRYEALDGLAALPGGRGAARIHDLAADTAGNLYMTEQEQNRLLRLDARTGAVTALAMPTPEGGPRRVHMDRFERFYFAQYRANKIGMLDTRSGEIAEWALPTPWTAPYDVATDRRGDLWAGGFGTDRILRIERETGTVTEYSLPRPTNVRRIFIDDATDPPSLWVGSTHGAAIVHIQPLD